MKEDMIFLLTGRFTQDCLENLFSLRFKQLIPNPLFIKQNLRVITITQISSCLKTTSYSNDRRKWFRLVKSDFFKLSKEIATREKAKEIDALMESVAIRIPDLQDNHMRLIDS